MEGKKLNELELEQEVDGSKLGKKKMAVMLALTAILTFGGPDFKSETNDTANFDDPSQTEFIADSFDISDMFGPAEVEAAAKGEMPDYTVHPEWPESKRKERMFKIMVDNGMLKQEKVDNFWTVKLIDSQRGIFEVRVTTNLSYYLLEYGKYFMNVYDFRSYNGMRDGKWQKRAGFTEHVKLESGRRSTMAESGESFFIPKPRKGRTEYYRNIHYSKHFFELEDDRTGERINQNDGIEFFEARLRIGKVYMADYMRRRLAVPEGKGGFHLSDWNLKTLIDLFQVMDKATLDKCLRDGRITKDMYDRYVTHF